MKLKEHLEQLANFKQRVMPKYKSLEAAYLERGIEFSNEPLSESEERELLALIGGGTYERKMCWANASNIALNSTLKFCEGFAISAKLPIPIHHAWLEFKGRAIDVTWGKTHSVSGKNIIKRVRANIAECEYFGVTVSESELRDALLETRVYDSVVMHQLRKSLTK